MGVTEDEPETVMLSFLLPQPVIAPSVPHTNVATQSALAKILPTFFILFLLEFFIFVV
jgi:hypothetical protein